MKADLGKLNEIAKAPNEVERAFEEDLSINGGWYRASKCISMKVKRALRAKGMTQANLAREMNVDAAAVSRYLNGRANLELKTIIRFEEILGIQIIDRVVNPNRKHYTSRQLQQMYNEEIEKSLSQQFENSLSSLPYPILTSDVWTAKKRIKRQEYTFRIVNENIVMTSFSAV